MPNPNGTPGNLVAAHPGNRSALRSGIYSGRVLAERAAEVADALMNAPHVHPLDRIAAEEIASLVAALEGIDRDIEQRQSAARGRASLLEHKARLSRELRTWLREFGGTPRARSEWAAQLASGTLLGDRIRARLEGDEVAR